ncbi:MULTISPECIES: M-like protein [Deinococcus]|uniref:M-like protein n=1 Tax=Deinococcus TaxID=1298 RepID=UPI0016693792|nr:MULTISPECIES: M-like protein [Deinococcus]MDK2011896.1 M-like protein [Deinococcus sp. 43]GGB49035.1 M-like protein [Deinococcus soli (ex Cha et al. 2016)]
MTDDKREIKTEDEISNVDLQFMGRSNPEAEIDAAVDAENKAPSDYRKEGLDKQDVAMTQTMDASDPPSTNMGDAEQ